MRLQVDNCIVAGAHGIAVLGLVTEVHKLDVERAPPQVVEIVGAAIGGRVPFAVTIGEQSIARADRLRPAWHRRPARPG